MNSLRKTSTPQHTKLPNDKKKCETNKPNDTFVDSYLLTVKNSLNTSEGKEGPGEYQSYSCARCGGFSGSLNYIRRLVSTPASSTKTCSEIPLIHTRYGTNNKKPFIAVVGDFETQFSAGRPIIISKPGEAGKRGGGGRAHECVSSHTLCRARLRARSALGEKIDRTLLRHWWVLGVPPGSIPTYDSTTL